MDTQETTPTQTAAREVTAYNLGRSAFRAGKMCAPALDRDLLALLEGNRLGQGLGTLKAWNAGWHYENLAARVSN